MRLNLISEKVIPLLDILISYFDQKKFFFASNAQLSLNLTMKLERHAFDK